MRRVRGTKVVAVKLDCKAAFALVNLASGLVTYAAVPGELRGVAAGEPGELFATTAFVLGTGENRTDVFDAAGNQVASDTIGGLPFIRYDPVSRRPFLRRQQWCGRRGALAVCL
jgi:hypothetical protein